MNRLIIFLFLVISLACSKPADIDIPKPESRLVLDAKLFLGDSVEATVKASYPAFAIEEEVSLNNKPVEILLFEDGQFVDKLENKNLLRNRYVSYFKPSKDRQYSISASYQGFPVAEGSTTLNLGNGFIEEARISQNGDEAELIVSIKDDGQQDGAFLMYVGFDSIPFRRDFRLGLTSYDPIVRTFTYSGVGSFDQESNSGVQFYISDSRFSGEEREFRFKIDDFQWRDYISKLDSLELNVVHIDRLWYDHEKSKFDQLRSFLGVFSEPARIVGNIKNGYGLIRAGRIEKIYLEL